MDTAEDNMIGVGIYSLTEASRLTGVSRRRIRRWVKGYSYRVGDAARSSDPVWQSQLPPIDGEIAIGFLDLIEVRFVDGFLKQGVTWPIIRRAEAHAKAAFKVTHPFATQRFRTDGRKIFADVLDEAGAKALLDLADTQFAFAKVIAPYLRGLEFEKNTAVRWRPFAQIKRVVIDPRRSFGQPIVDKEGVPTAVLARAFEAEGSESAVAKWYEVDVRSVRDAVEFEKRLAA